MNQSIFVVLSLISSAFSSISSYESVTLADKINSVINTITNGEETNYKFSFNLTKNDNKFKIFEMYDESGYKGYVLFDGENNIKTIYKGEYKPNSTDDLYELSPIFAKENEDNLSTLEETSNQVATSSSYPTPTMITLNQDLYESEYNGFSSTQIINDCPFYYNYSYGPVRNGCSPTTAAMLISFYDRYSSLTNLVTGVLPLEHSDNKTAVDNLITTLADYMDTDPDVGTYKSGEINGLTNYFKDKGYSNYKAYCSTNYDSISYCINNQNNPAFLSIKCYSDDDVLLGNHAVLGVGLANIRYSGLFMITHYNWRNQRTGDYYVPKDHFNYSIYIGRK